MLMAWLTLSFTLTAFSEAKEEFIVANCASYQLIRVVGGTQKRDRAVALVEKMILREKNVAKKKIDIPVSEAKDGHRDIYKALVGNTTYTIVRDPHNNSVNHFTFSTRQGSKISPTQECSPPSDSI